MDPDFPFPPPRIPKTTEKPKSTDKTDFLFVNETIRSTEYKVGHRPAIRSHVRRHGTKHFKPNNKPARKIAPTISRSRKPPHTLAGQNDAHPPLHDSDCETRSVKFSSSTTEEQSDPPVSDQDSSLYCKACKKLLDRTTPNMGTVVLKRPKPVQQSKLSPLEILGSGRSDPFSTYPVENPDGSLHDLMDFVVTYFVPRLCPDDASSSGFDTGANIVSKAWFTAGLQNPLLFHALAFAGLIHMDFLRYNQIYPNSVRALPHKLIVIQMLNKAIASGSEMSTDDVILAILVLASHETLKVTEEKRRPFNSPLRDLQWINVYGHIKYLDEHRKAVLDLLNLRGGLETLQLPGLAETIVGGDIMSAINSFTHPILPLLRSHETYIVALKVWASNADPQLASAFWNLQQFGITADLLDVLDAMAALTLAIQHHQSRAPGCLTMGQIARTKTAVSKRLLLLPSLAELAGVGVEEKNYGEVQIYECCRLAAMIFHVALLAPMPDTFDVLQMHVSHLKTALLSSGLLSSSSDLRKRGNGELEDFLRWCLVMGGIAALEKEERGWFVERLVEFKVGEWDVVKQGMERFLWDEGACGEGGVELWCEVMELREGG